MPKFLVTASEVNFFRGIVEAENLDALYEIDIEDMGLVEYDGEALEIQLVEEIKE